MTRVLVRPSSIAVQHPPFCATLTPADKKRMKRLVRIGQRLNKETGYLKCANGRITGEAYGRDEFQMKFDRDLCPDRNVYLTPKKRWGKPEVNSYLFHTHTEGARAPDTNIPAGVTHYLSALDLSMASSNFVRFAGFCVGFLKNGRPKARCVRTYDVNMSELEEAVERHNAGKIFEGWGLPDFTERARYRDLMRTMAKINHDAKSCVVDL